MDNVILDSGMFGPRDGTSGSRTNIASIYLVHRQNPIGGRSFSQIGALAERKEQLVERVTRLLITEQWE